MNAIAVIPARYASQRLPGKPIVKIAGIPLVIRVWQNVSKSEKLAKVFIACDDERIAQVCREYGADYVMTEPDLPSGTDRIFSALKLTGINADVVLNVQGDEPFIQAQDLDYMLGEFEQSDADVATMIKAIDNQRDLFDSSCVKALIAPSGLALYFSRAPIPYFRDLPESEWHKQNTYWKHIGVYAYKTEALTAFSELPVSHLENIEKLEQLRLLEQGYKYLCVKTEAELIGVDTPEDLIRAEKRINAKL